MKTTPVIQKHIEIVEGVRGPKLRIVGSRIRVLDIVIWHEEMGLSPAEIASEHPTITLADVHAALAYYWDHREQIDQAIADEDAFAEEMRPLFHSPSTEKLNALRRG